MEHLGVFAGVHSSLESRNLHLWFKLGRQGTLSQPWLFNVRKSLQRLTAWYIHASVFAAIQHTNLIECYKHKRSFAEDMNSPGETLKHVDYI